jgi:LPXTG-site transpeptidase (sortase) family protein
MTTRGRGLLGSLGLIALLILVGAAVAIGLGGAPQSQGTVVPSPVSSPVSSDRPPAASPHSAAPASAVASPVAQPTDRIRIDRLGIDLPIMEGDGIDAPLDGVAHYPGTGWPGDGTNIYLYAHARPGLFEKLPQAEVGDRIVLTMADGSSHDYDVAKIVPAAPWDAIEYVAKTPSEQLTLQTSTSEVPTDPRFIVIAYPTS